MPSSHLQTAGYVVAFALAAGAAFCCAEPAVAQSEPSPTPAPPAVSAAPLASPAPSAEPLATPVPTPTPPLRELLLEAGYTLGKVYNNYANGITGNGTSYVASGAYRLGSWAVKLDDRSDQYTTQINVPGPPGPGTGFLAPDGTYEVVPPFTGRVTSIDTRLEHQAFTKNVYLGLSYIDTSTTYGYPSLRGVGGGIEQYSNFTPFGLYGFLFYYPNVSGTFLQTDAKSPNFGKSYGVNFSELKYSFETALPLSYDFYLYFGYGGYRMLTGGDNTAQNVEGPFLGLGTRLFRAGAALDEPEVTRVEADGSELHRDVAGRVQLGRREYGRRPRRTQQLRFLPDRRASTSSARTRSWPTCTTRASRRSQTDQQPDDDREDERLAHPGERTRSRSRRTCSTSASG